METEKQIELINKSLVWISENRPEQYEQRFFNLLRLRCKLRKIKLADKDNPAIAAYGESQKGKSYLMGNLLQQSGRPFMIKCQGIDHVEQNINFVSSINPIGDAREATGVVTRFTSFSRHSEEYDCQHPILVKLLSVGDIATILADGYYNDLTDYQIYSLKELNTMGNKIYDEYKGCPVISNTALIEDDIMYIKSYLSKYLSNSGDLWESSSIFEKISLVVRKIPKVQWSNVLSFLWHKNKDITRLFQRLVDALSKLRFKEDVYLPIGAVLHHGDNINTIMSVKCLRGIENANNNLVTDVFLKENNNHIETIHNFNKSEICALCAEVTYKVDEEYLHSESQYNFEMIPEETKVNIQNNGFVKKDILSECDLLDFPGAKNRLNNREIFLSQENADTGSSNLVETFLRGKVAYLFNNYCDSKVINILLFCQDYEANHVTTMYNTLENWVNEYIGKDIDSRRNKVNMADGIPPLFVIATKFNYDMKKGNTQEQNSRIAIDQRWEGRFNEVLYGECFNASNVNWFNNWITEGETFKNCFLLRDYKFSGCNGSGNNLYEGYNEGDENPSESRLNLPSEYYDLLRESFVNSEYVQNFFENPSKSWDLAATINNDGSLYIIEKLSTVANKMSDIRENDFRKQLEHIRNDIYEILKDDYEPEDGEQSLEKKIHRAKSIERELDFSCNENNYFFGHLIQKIQPKSTKIYNAVHQMLNSPELNSQVNNFNNYELILRRCHYFKDAGSGNGSTDRKWEILIQAYDLGTKEKAIEYLRKRNIEYDKLFIPDAGRRINSYIISKMVYDDWISYLRSTDMLNVLSEEPNFDESVLTLLLENVINTADSLSLVDRMSNMISEYVDVMALHCVNANMVTDILCHIISSFVVDLGYSYRTDEEVNNCMAVAKQNGLNLFQLINAPQPPELTTEDITNLFVEMTQKPQTVTPSFYHNYREWIEYMYVSFLVSGEHRKNSVEANAEIGEILNELNGTV